MKHCYKVVVIGDAGVGKSEILASFVTPIQSPRFAGALDGRRTQSETDSPIQSPREAGALDRRETSPSYSPTPSPRGAGAGSGRATIGVEFYIKETPQVKLHLWDTAGQERFRSVTTQYFRHTHAVILVFALDNPESLAHLEDWKALADPRALFMILGNKADACVPHASAQKLYPDIPYFVTSARTGQGIQEAFADLIRRLEENEHTQEEKLTIRVGSFENSPPTQRRCCGGTG